MRHDEQRTIIIVSYVVGVFLNWLIEFLPDKIVGIGTLLSSVRVVSILTGWWLFYFKIGWKLPLLKKMLFRNDLNGTWFGKYESRDLKNGGITNGEIAIRIVQDYLSASFISYTKKYRNDSYGEEVKYDKRSKTCGIVYTYSQEENGIFDAGQRNGTSELMLATKNDNSEDWLEGVFWTIHGTQGSICVRRISRRHIDSFDEAKNVSETRSMN